MIRSSHILQNICTQHIFDVGFLSGQYNDIIDTKPDIKKQLRRIHNGMV